jgi:small subunit ribosomal protein S8
MSHSDPIADMIARIKNALMRGKKTVLSPDSKVRTWILDVLHKEGFIVGYERVLGSSGHYQLRIDLKYSEYKPVIQEIIRISKPGKRVYKGARDIPPVMNNLGISIVSTSRGVMTDREARTHGVGGEILCTVF